MIDHHTDYEIAVLLSKRGVLSPDGRRLHRLMIRNLRLTYGLKSRYDRLREVGYLTREEVAERLGIVPATVKLWRRNGWLRATAYNDKPEFLYEVPGPDAPKKGVWKRRLRKNTSSSSERSAV